ncbi:uncharacterized protein LOC130649125 [Hydractinia symbiolongicarpus]|uniref:uncharacterized protein LOC130649125 n=1 Tax=Hydractinia symbiolongicarpus TaxID=13093 RepID=UPI0025516093|nr:uncharacterized protein LOC130649125 [Hydractinia symbiolongicarpus]
MKTLYFWLCLFCVVILLPKAIGIHCFEHLSSKISGKTRVKCKDEHNACIDATVTLEISGRGSTRRQLQCENVGDNCNNYCRSLKRNLFVQLGGREFKMDCKVSCCLTDYCNNSLKITSPTIAMTLLTAICSSLYLLIKTNS